MRNEELGVGTQLAIHCSKAVYASFCEDNPEISSSLAFLHGHEIWLFRFVKPRVHQAIIGFLRDSIRDSLTQTRRDLLSVTMNCKYNISNACQKVSDVAIMLVNMQWHR